MPIATATGLAVLPACSSIVPKQGTDAATGQQIEFSLQDGGGVAESRSRVEGSSSINRSYDYPSTDTHSIPHINSNPQCPFKHQW